MKYDKYYIRLLWGIGCFFLFFKLFDIQWLSILLDIISIFAGGIFASTVVAIFIEKINYKYYVKQIENQKIVLLRDIINGIPYLVKRELKNLNSACYYISGNSSLKDEEIQITTYDSIDKIIEYLEKIERIQSEKEVKIFDQNYLKQQNSFEKFFYSNWSLYESLNKACVNLNNNAIYLITNNIISNDDRKELMKIFDTLEDIINYSKDKNFGLTISFKKLFFKYLKEFIDYFKISDLYKKNTDDQKLYLFE